MPAIVRAAPSEVRVGRSVLSPFADGANDYYTVSKIVGPNAFYLHQPFEPSGPVSDFISLGSIDNLVPEIDSIGDLRQGTKALTTEGREVTVRKLFADGSVFTARDLEGYTSSGKTLFLPVIEKSWGGAGALSAAVESLEKMVAYKTQTSSVRITSKKNLF